MAPNLEGWRVAPKIAFPFGAERGVVTNTERAKVLSLRPS